jgi:hypothetical protein
VVDWVWFVMSRLGGEWAVCGEMKLEYRKCTGKRNIYFNIKFGRRSFWQLEIIDISHGRGSYRGKNYGPIITAGEE